MVAEGGVKQITRSCSKSIQMWAFLILIAKIFTVPYFLLSMFGFATLQINQWNSEKLKILLVVNNKLVFAVNNNLDIAHLLVLWDKKMSEIKSCWAPGIPFLNQNNNTFFPPITVGLKFWVTFNHVWNLPWCLNYRTSIMHPLEPLHCHFLLEFLFRFTKYSSQYKYTLNYARLT